MCPPQLDLSAEARRRKMRNARPMADDDGLYMPAIPDYDSSYQVQRPRWRIASFADIASENAGNGLLTIS
jgi:hypothetical protein